MDTSDKVDRLTTILDACLLPELTRDLGTDPLDSKLFDDYRQILDTHLIQLFDLIQQNEDLLYDTEGYTRQFRSKFLLMLCEQSAPKTMYQTKDIKLLDNLNKLVEKHLLKMLSNDLKLLTEIFDFYKNRLRKDVWKRHLGPIHGFVRFVEVYYCTNGNQFTTDLCSYCLSVGALLEEFYDPVYKEMSFGLFYAILTQTPEDILQQLNLHSFFYEMFVRNIPKIKTKSGNAVLWNGLIHCLKLIGTSDCTKWNKTDDVIEALIRRITLESNADICIELFSNFSKIFLVNSVNLSRSICAVDEMVLNGICEADLNMLSDEGKRQKQQIFFKWAKRLLKLFVAESYRLLTTESVAVPLLRSMHLCYALCIMSIPTKICERHLVEFLKKFMPVLMEMIQVHQQSLNICQTVKEFLTTISHHLAEDSYQDAISNDMLLYRTNIDKILLLPIFE